MAGDSETIKSFLIALGFRVDESGLRRFTEGILGASKVAVEMGAAVIGAATGVVAAVAKMSEAGEQLYYMSQRVKASAANINAFAYAVSQMGGTAEGARQSLEGLANFLRSSPGASNLLRAIGVNPNEDSTNILEDLGTRLRSMPRYRANVYASLFGIDQNTLNALLGGVQSFANSYAAMLQKAGVRAGAYARNSRDFMRALREQGAAWDILGMKVDTTLAKGLTTDVQRFTALITNNFGAISAFITKVANGILWMANATVTLIVSAAQGFEALQGWFDRLSPSTQRVLDEFAALLIAWRLLNTAFLTSPLGMLFLFASAILLLWNDYQTWKEGGKSLIDWAKWKPDIDKAIAAITEIVGLLNEGAKAVGGWQVVLDAFATYLATKWVISVVASFAKATAAARAFLGLGGAGRAAAAAGEGAAAAGGAEAAGGLALVGGPVLGIAALGAALIALWPRSAGSGEEAELQRRGLGLGSARKLPPDIEAEVRWAAKANGVDPDLAVAQFMQEGGGYNKVSSAGAIGPAQLMPGTAASLGVATSPDDPNYSWQTNTDAGVKYFSQLLARYHGDYVRALVGYNWGPGNADKWDGKLSDLPQETQTYLARILSNAQRMKLSAPINAIAQRAASALAKHNTNSLPHPGQDDNAYMHPGNIDPSTGLPIPRGFDGSIPQGYHPMNRITGPNTPPHSVQHHYQTTINQNNNVTVNGARDPQQTAAAVQRHQQKFNSQVVRNLPVRIA